MDQTLVQDVLLPQTQHFEPQLKLLSLRWPAVHLNFDRDCGLTTWSSGVKLVYKTLMKQLSKAQSSSKMTKVSHFLQRQRVGIRNFVDGGI